MKTVLLLCTFVAISAFNAGPTFVTRTDTTVLASRRSILDHAVLVGAGLLLQAPAAMASGGATAGGAYLLSAKQRYNDRVKAAMKGFLSLQKPLESGSIDEIKSYFSSEDVGAWADGSAAGYLLANAFRRNSSAAPDTLPSVKKWKTFAAAVESFMKAAKKNKDPAATLDAYKAAVTALEGYLVEVELPSTAEL